MNYRDYTIAVYVGKDGYVYRITRTDYPSWFLQTDRMEPTRERAIDEAIEFIEEHLAATTAGEGVR